MPMLENQGDNVACAFQRGDEMPFQRPDCEIGERNDGQSDLCYNLLVGRFLMDF